MRFKKGDNILATNRDTNRHIQFKCPAQMCNKLLKRYIVMYLGEHEGDWLFTKQ